MAMVSRSTWVIGLIFSVSATAQSICTDQSSNEAIYGCLNNYAKTRLASGSPADVRYRDRVGRLLSRYGLNVEQVQAKALDSTFTVYVTEEPELSAAVGAGKCFDFQSMYGYNRRPLVDALIRQIDEIALFLSEIQARTWGHQVSILFPIREVNICSRSKINDRPLVFEQRSLVLGMNGNEVMPASKILEIWNSGSPVRGREQTYLGDTFLGKKARELHQKVNGDYEALIRDRLADYWAILNPTGTVRTSAFYVLTSMVLKYADRLNADRSALLEPDQIHDRLMQIASGPGFSAEDRETIRNLKGRSEDLRGVFQLWLKRLRNPVNMLHVIENAIGEKAGQNAHLHLALRKVNAGLAVMNDKTISVRLEQLMQTSLPVSHFEAGDLEQTDEVEVTRSEPVNLPSGQVGAKTTTVKIRGRNARDVRINGDEVNAGMVVDLIDDVLVSVQMPKISAEAYGRVSLYQALHDYQSGIRESNGEPLIP